MAEPDFTAVEETLVAKTVNALRAFAAEHRDEQFRYFAFDCNPDYGEVLLCLDTGANSIKNAKNAESRATKHRLSALRVDHPEDLPFAFVTVNHPIYPVQPYGNNTGNFLYQGFTDTITFDDWEDFACSDEYPGELPDTGKDYLECNVIGVLTRVIDRLVESQAFDCLQLTSPFLVGFGLHSGLQVVVRIINW